ncbi:lipoprotein-releasing ABC transporter permease subunit LolE [Vibrio sp. WJH972]
MMGSLSLWIGQRFSRSKKRNKLVSFISVSSTLGIAFGVAVIIVGLSAMNGFEQELQKRVLSVIPHGEFEAVDDPITNWSSIQTQLASEPHIEAAAPYVRFTGLAEKGAKLKAVVVRGVDLTQEQRVSDLFSFIDEGTLSDVTPGQNEIILGKGLARYLGVEKGEYLTLLVPPDNKEKSLKSPQRIRLKVTALFTLNGQIDHNMAIIPLTDAQHYLRLGESVHGMSVRVDDVFNALNIVRESGNKLNVFVYLRSWENQYGYLYRDIQLVRIILYLVMVLVIGVASFNIVSTLMMAVKDRSSDIAILRTMGASDGMIKRIFVWQGVWSGVTGSVLGTAFGVALAVNLTRIIRGVEQLTGYTFLSGDIYFVDFLPSKVELVDVAVVSVTAILLSLFATWYPAKRASALQPAAVLSAK